MGLNRGQVVEEGVKVPGGGNRFEKVVQASPRHLPTPPTGTADASGPTTAR